MNWLAILCAAVAYWVLGYVWYSLLFGKLWCAELLRHRGERPAPTGGEMASKLISTFVANFIAAAAMCYLIKRTAIADVNHALKLAAATGIGFAGTAVTMISIWESKPTTMWFIDAAYYFLGAILLATIFVCWP